MSSLLLAGTFNSLWLPDTYEFSLMHGRHIVRCYGTRFEKESVDVFMEQALCDLLELTGKPPLARLQQLQLAFDICAGVKFLHDHKIVHYNLKGANVLIVCIVVSAPL